jgi:hypothetical protein
MSAWNGKGLPVAREQKLVGVIAKRRDSEMRVRQKFVVGGHFPGALGFDSIILG